MNIGIDFNTRVTRAAVFDKQNTGHDGKIFEMKNVFAFANESIFVGAEAVNKFITENKASFYDLDQIVELNGLIINKRQVGIEKCLSIIFSQLLKEISNHFDIKTVDCVCVSIPYDKSYIWHEFIPKAFSLLDIKKVRIISQPAAFFAPSDSKILHDRLNKRLIDQDRENMKSYQQKEKEYLNTPWYKKLATKKPQKAWPKEKPDYLFISISQGNSNVSLVNYDGIDSSCNILEVVGTEYTDSITEKEIRGLVTQHVISEIRRLPENFSIMDEKTRVRIKEAVSDLLDSRHIHSAYELVLPYIVCGDGQYRTLTANIDMGELGKILTPIFARIDSFIEKSINTIQGPRKIKRSIGDIVIAGSPLIQEFMKNDISKLFKASRIIDVDKKSLAFGAAYFSQIMTGDRKDFLALDVIPFSIQIRLKGGEFVEMIAKDRTIPTMSEEHCFQVGGSGKSKYIEVQLTTKEGSGIQSLDVWKVKIDDWKAFRVQIDIDANMKINLKAFPQDASKPFDQKIHYASSIAGIPKWELETKRGSTFSFNGSGFEMGIKGKSLRQYILNQFNYLGTIFSDKHYSIFEPNDQFYSFLKSGDPLSALRQLGVPLNLKSIPDVEISDSKIFEEQGVAGFISGNKISIPQSFKDDPHGFGYVLAHELAHYILIHEEGVVLDNEQENEILTEIFVIYCGMGKLFLNGFNTGKGNEFTKGSRGYLDDKIIKYIHEICFEKFNINVESYKNNLTKAGRSLLD